MTDREPQCAQPPKRHIPATRTRGGQNRTIYQHLGVRDLREIINRKRSERSHPNETVIPPPDPSYSYLKDPMRENAEQNVQDSPKQITARKHKHYPNDSNKRDKEYHRGQPSVQMRHQDIENPLNIKVKFSTSTGERCYKFDESTVLPTIKHVPDHTLGPNRSFRGRGRGRGRGPRNYHTRTARNNKRPNNESKFEGTQMPIQISVPTEENWDNELQEAKAVSEVCGPFEHECPDSKDCAICENFEESYEHLQEDNEEDIGLEKHVENLKLIEGDSLELQSKNEDRKEPQN